MPEKPYTKKWLRERLDECEREHGKGVSDALPSLVSHVRGYLDHLDEIDSRRGCGMSEKKLAAMSTNGKKGGWKKGRPRKPKVV